MTDKQVAKKKADQQNNQQAVDGDTVSPATRLLEKRRMMYENQESYKHKKKEFAQEEAKFYSQEQELQRKDTQIQESLIEFSSYLDSNQKQMKNSDANIAKLQAENVQKDMEIVRKSRILDILKQKAVRIENQRKAVQKYQDFLDEVRSNNSDQYGSIAVIMDRHNTLQALQENLKKDLQTKELELNTMRSDFVKYESQMSTNTMQLNNTIANLKRQSDKIDDEKNRLKSQEQENSSAQLEKITQLSKMLMAIDHLEGFCMYRKLLYQRGERLTNLNYTAVTMHGPERNRQFTEISQNHFDSYQDRAEYAKSQIFIIGRYLRDLAIVKERVMAGDGKPEVRGKTQDDALE